MFILWSLAAAKCNKVPNDYEIISNGECADSISNEILSKFSNSFGKSTKINTANAVLSGIFLIYPALYFVLGMFGKED